MWGVGQCTRIGLLLPQSCWPSTSRLRPARLTLTFEQARNSNAPLAGTDGSVTRTCKRTIPDEASFGLGCCRRGGPMRRSFCSEEAQYAAGDKVTLDVEGVVDGGMNSKEALR